MTHLKKYLHNVSFMYRCDSMPSITAGIFKCIFGNPARCWFGDQFDALYNTRNNLKKIIFGMKQFAGINK